MAITKLELNTQADEASIAVELIYRKNLAEMDDPDGWAFNGEFRPPRDGEVFLNRAGEVTLKTPRMLVLSPRLILLPYNPRIENKAAPIAREKYDRLRQAFESGLPGKVAGCLAGVSTRTANTYYERFEMLEWRRSKERI